MTRRSDWAEVDLQHLRENYLKLQTYTKSEMMPVVKADAYGHGVIPAVRTLWACGARRFGVAFLEEALEIKAVFPEAVILIMGATDADEAEVLVREGIIPAIISLTQAQAISRAAAGMGKKAKVHIKVDTGMNRIGFREEELAAVLKVASLPNLELEGIFTHFAAADQKDLAFAREQLSRFEFFYDRLKKAGVHIPLRHAANSAAILQLPEAHFELVRPGISLYGFAPEPEEHFAHNPTRDDYVRVMNVASLPETRGETGFVPVMSWKARVSHVKEIQAGESVSYGRTFQADGLTRVATVPVGYADGLRRGLSNQAEMLVRGTRVKVIGRICMDQTMLDVTAVPEVQVGDVVTILGDDGAERITAMEMARLLDTISYEVVCGISKRVPRIYENLSD